MARALIVGAGGMGRAWGKNLLECEETEIVAWVDIRAQAASEAAEALEMKGVHTGDDLAKAIAETKPDFVVDVTIPEAHCEVTLLALHAGVPVLGEKPMATSMEEARQIGRAHV